MRKSIRKILAALALVLIVPTSSASVLTFDDLVGGPTFFIANYDGFQFGTNSAATTAWFYTDMGLGLYFPHSGTHFVATDFSLYSGGLSEATQPISRTTPFVFNGAYFSGIDRITYRLFLGSALVYTSLPSAALTDASTFVASGYAGAVTSVVVVGHQGFFALDDFTYGAVVAAVPEPQTLSLLAVGLVGLGLTIRRRRR